MLVLVVLMNNVISENQKQTGSFYTPSNIAHYLVRQSLYIWLNLHRTAKTEITQIENDEQFFDFINEWDPGTLEEILPKLIILDPAVGEGIFLLEAASIIEKIYQTISTNTIDRKVFRKKIICNHIHGWDIQPRAIGTTKWKIIQWIQETPLNSIDAQLEW